MNANDTVTISKHIYDELVDDSEFLQFLIEQGVDNWPGYGEARMNFREFKQERKQEAE